jgi:hypothetical protein
MTTLTRAELLAQVQRRVARLLLRHDRRTFRGHFREWQCASAPPTLPLLHAYNHFARLLLLADELLNDILPRIHRQMSFQTPRQTRDEEAPLRGQINWDASLRRSWNERPGHPPTRFVTNQRCRTFATPENALVVAVLEHYARALARAREGQMFPDVPMSSAEQRELSQIEEHVCRELGTIHLQEAARTSSEQDVSNLAAAVEKRLPPGSTPYRDLLAWWWRFEKLRLGREEGKRQRLLPVLESRDSADHLYLLWVVLELVELLEGHGLLANPRISPRELAFDFQWQGQVFHLAYHRAPPPTLPAAAREQQSPSLTSLLHYPLCLITRANPLVVEYAEREIWREPGVLLDARCILPDEQGIIANAVSHTLATLVLLDATKALFVLSASAEHQRVRLPPGIFYATTPPDTELRFYEACPPHQADLLASFPTVALLNQTAAWLPPRPPVACHGMHQDEDTVNLDGNGPQCCKTCGAVLLLCPRPHIAPNHVGLACPRCDCLHNPVLCHVMAQPEPVGVVAPFVRRTRTQDDLVETIQAMRARLQRSVAADAENDQADTARSSLFQAVGELVDTYMEFATPDTSQIEYLLREGFFQGVWSNATHPRGLPEEVRQMLISGDYVRSRFQQSSVKDWAACAIQYVRALEYEITRRIYEPCGTRLITRQGQPMTRRAFSFGTPGATYYRRASNDHNPHNWAVFLACLVEPARANLAAFEHLLADIEKLRNDRNRIAHTHLVDEPLAETVRTAVVGKIGTPGVLCRLAELLDPPPPAAHSPAP